MAEIVSGLFGLDPLQIRRQEEQQRQFFANQFAQTYADPYEQSNALRGGMVGNALSGFLGGLFGLQSPELKRATTLESILQQTQQEVGSTDPAVLYPALQKRLADGGFGREALRVGELAQQAIQNAQLSEAKLQTAEAQRLRALREPNEKRYLAVGKNIYDTTTGEFIAAPDSGKDTEVPSTDKLLSEAIATLNNPSASQEEQARATNIYNQLFPLKAPAGMAGYVPVNPRQGVAGGVQPIPGSKAENAVLMAEQKAVSSIAGRLQSAQDVSNIVDEAVNLVGEGTTGLVGKGLSVLPGTQAFKLSGALDTLKANIGFDELQAMRDASPTGGALGQVAVQEINFLQATIAKIEQGLAPKDLKANLLKVKESYNRLQNELFKKLPKTVDNLRFDPKFAKLSGKERDAYLTKVYQNDPEFQALPEEEQIAKLNEIGQLNERRQVTIKGKTYKRPVDFTDEEWAEYINFTKKQKGVAQNVGF